ncbi:hypothetical protein TREES_T100014099 [Tupaia chinensis]|uniref:Uncharacterized protein n=1 Tax=Tupaia chinensis TaxID=246437 RepID=L9KJY8_TUPCH|nr:hypothetical protein TREES_T100014099 [Tupaia chinensis]
MLWFSTSRGTGPKIRRVKHWPNTYGIHKPHKRYSLHRGGDTVMGLPGPTKTLPSEVRKTRQSRHEGGLLPCSMNGYSQAMGDTGGVGEGSYPLRG